MTVKDPDQDAVGRSLFTAIADTGLSGYPGLHLEHASPRATEYGIYWPGLVSADAVRPEVVLADGTRIAVPEPPREAYGGDARERAAAGARGKAYAGGSPTVRAPLGELIGARSGDKGGDANVGLWARDDAAYAWLLWFLTTDRMRELLPESASCGSAATSCRTCGRSTSCCTGCWATASPPPPGRSAGQELGRVPAGPTGRRTGGTAAAHVIAESRRPSST